MEIIVNKLKNSNDLKSGEKVTIHWLEYSTIGVHSEPIAYLHSKQATVFKSEMFLDGIKILHKLRMQHLHKDVLFQKTLIIEEGWKPSIINLEWLENCDLNNIPDNILYFQKG